MSAVVPGSDWPWSEVSVEGIIHRRTIRLSSPHGSPRHLLLQLCPQHADHIIRSDDPRQLVMLIDDGKSLQIVLIEKLSHLVFLSALLDKDKGLLSEREHGCGGLRQHQPRQRNRAGQRSVRIHQVYRAYRFHSSFK